MRRRYDQQPDAALRHSYQQTYRRKREQIEERRAAGDRSEVDLPGLQRRVPYCEIDGWEADLVARCYAERISQRAINQAAAAESRARMRANEAQ